MHRPMRGDHRPGATEGLATPRPAAISPAHRCHTHTNIQPGPLTKEKPGCWTHQRAFAQVRWGSNIQLLPYSFSMCSHRVQLCALIAPAAARLSTSAVLAVVVRVSVVVGTLTGPLGQPSARLAVVPAAVGSGAHLPPAVG